MTVLIFLLLALTARPDGLLLSNAQDPLDRTQELYEGAAYEEALASLPSTPAAGQEDDVDRYRVLCLLALGRQPEARQVFEAALTRNFAFRIPEASPRVLDFVVDLRQRVLPVRAESLYEKGRTDFEDRKYEEAVGELSTFLSLLGEPELGRLAHLRPEAEQLRKTAGERLEMIATAAARLRRDTKDPVYTRLSVGVSLPVAHSRELPRWDPPRDQAWRTFRGIVEVVIDQEGRVESARMVETLAPFYDRLLAEAALHWRFEPARRADGAPVRFRHQIEITMRPTAKN